MVRLALYPAPELRYSTAMSANTSRLTSIVEAYLEDLRRVRASGGATAERSTYTALSNLFDSIGATLRPKVVCVPELADQGAGHPDFGLYAASQVQRGTPRQGQIPECGVVEVKPPDDDAWLTAEGDQVSRYWDRYRLVLVTNTRDFMLLGSDTNGNPARLERFSLADSDAAFGSMLQRPRASAREVGAALGEYLCRALSHRAALSEPGDLAWLLASYARDGLARVEAAGATSSLVAVRSALEGRWKSSSGANAATRSSGQPWCRRSSMGSSPAGYCGRARLRLRPAPSTGMMQHCTCGYPCWNRCSGRSPSVDVFGLLI